MEILQIFWLVSVLLEFVSGQERRLELPSPGLCRSRSIHHREGTVGYLLSWQEPAVKTTHLDWLDARNWCRHRCMDLIGFENAQEYIWAKNIVKQNSIGSFWTSGRRCDFGESCNRADLLPVDVNGWFWSATNTKMAPTNRRNTQSNDWFYTGVTGRPQPDNSNKRFGGTDESCMAVINKDGIGWHDVECHQRKQWICEDSPELRAYARSFSVPKQHSTRINFFRSFNN